jgi:outer membrane scaffolding protein for murein synthesis (MipA/OmpV family)
VSARAAGAWLAVAFAVLPLRASAQEPEPIPARDAPLWEFGLGLAGLRYPDYRGSDQSRNLVLPLPYFIYRGDFLRSDREGMRGVLFNNDRLDLNLSLGASPPVSSNGSSARSGMPDLKPSIELGPALDWTLWRGADPRSRLSLSLPVRGVVSVEASPRFLGWVATPRLNLDLPDRLLAPGWNWGWQAGALFADQRQNAYYYTVDRAYATAARPAYTAAGGYAGYQFTTALSRRFPGWWVGAYLRYDSVAGAVFEGSPLVRSAHNLYAGVGFAVILDRSGVRVRARDDE